MHGNCSSFFRFFLLRFLISLLILFYLFFSAKPLLLFNPKSGRMNKYPGPSEDGLYYCSNRCGKKYKSKQAISVHMRYECGVKPKFYCQECNKYFKQPVSFKAHKMNVHKYVMEYTDLKLSI